MTNNDQTGMNAERTREEVRAAVERGDKVREDVRDIVIEALGEHHLDKKNVERTIATVVEGTVAGTHKDSKELAETMRKTIGGLDEAMAKAAQASKLAIEEATGRVEEFSEQDLKQAVDDLKDLEKLFLGTLSDLAKAGHATAGSALHELVTHSERTGTEIGKSVNEALQSLHGPLSRAERPHLSDVGKAARTGAASLASVASGILAGIADSLAHQEQGDGEKSEKKDA